GSISRQLTSKDLSRLLFGKAENSIKGSFPEILERSILFHADHPEALADSGLLNMVDPMTATFRIDINKKSDDAELPPLSTTGRARVHFSELGEMELMPGLVIRNIDSLTTVQPIEKTDPIDPSKRQRGLKIEIPSATIGRIEYKNPGRVCGG